MKIEKLVIIMAFWMLAIAGCTDQKNGEMKEQTANPFYTEYQTPFQTPPFNLIKAKHYMPAFEEGIRLAEIEVDQIATNHDPPTFENTIVAMERKGKLLDKVSSVFFNLLSAETNDSLKAISKKVSPMLSEYSDNIKLNEQLFQRIKTLYDNRDNLNLDPESAMLLEKYYKRFVRGGAGLPEDKKKELRKINSELSLLTLQFGDNILEENNRFELVIDDKKDLAGLPDMVISAAAEAAKSRGHEGKWVFTLHKPSLIPFLQYSDRRDLREKMFTGYIERGNHNDSLDNKKVLVKIVNLREKRAKLLGYKSHADYVLEENMAKKPENVYKLLDQIWTPAIKVATHEAADMQKMIDAEGGHFKLEPWDWWYYAEKVKKAKYNLDEGQLRPYFELENVRKGIFWVANRLYGITFEERDDIPVYNPDVKVYEVKDRDGSHIGIYYTDYFPRPGKRGGAWMNEYREEENINGEHITPIIVNVGNFTKPSGDTPALLSLDETLTMFHEFGHALHGLLSKVTYPSLSGTSVPRDFVELPSQIMENWALEPEVLKMYAKHYKTGAPMPEELIEKIKKSGYFNQGFATTEYLAASYLDMDWHTIEKPFEGDPMKFENESMAKIHLIPEIVPRYRSPYFRHIFAGGYSAGYYSYIWAEVLDADGFAYFKETNIFDQEKAAKFRKYILAAGGSADPMEMYIRFRGREPETQALLHKRGLDRVQ